jgi:hypothetical protein
MFGLKGKKPSLPTILKRIRKPKTMNGLGETTLAQQAVLWTAPDRSEKLNVLVAS